MPPVLPSHDAEVIKLNYNRYYDWLENRSQLNVRQEIFLGLL
jgi:hypothetical protein